MCENDLKFIYFEGIIYWLIWYCSCIFFCFYIIGWDGHINKVMLYCSYLKFKKKSHLLVKIFIWKNKHKAILYTFFFCGNCLINFPLKRLIHTYCWLFIIQTKCHFHAQQLVLSSLEWINTTFQLSKFLSEVLHITLYVKLYLVTKA